jgi:hypothetical protein
MFQARNISNTERIALERLISVAKDDADESKYVAEFLLGWWNAARYGGADLTDIWGFSRESTQDMLQVFGFIARSRGCCPDELGYDPGFETIIERWRPRKAN